MQPMRRSTVCRHLREVAEIASRLHTVAHADGALMGVSVAGDILGPAERVADTTVVLTLDMLPEELPWRAAPSALWALAEMLRLTKRPMMWVARPASWPGWTVRHRRVVRIWSGIGGADEEVLEALTQPSPSHPAILEPSDEAYLTQVRTELAVARQHLSEVLDKYWDPDWRRAHKGGGVHPEDHLWRAAQAVEELTAASG